MGIAAIQAIGLKKESYNDELQTENISVLNPLSNPVESISRAPFQIMLENAVDAIQNVSNTENQNNKLIDEFIQGKISVDEVMISTNQLNLEMSLLTTVVNTSVQTFKEIQQMQV